MKQFALLAVPLLLQLGFSASQAQSLKGHIQAEVVVRKAMSPEAITLSDDGNQLTFIAKTMREFTQAPPTTAWLAKKDANGKWSEPQKLNWRGMVTSVSFANQDRWLVVSNSYGSLAGYKEILKNLFGDREKIGDLIGFRHRIEFYDANQPKKLLQSLSPQSVGLAKPEMLKHARVSPDGKWLTFYTHGYEDQRGVYVYNFATKRTVHLGLYDDKHPTWTPDGSKILFHHQEGGNSFHRTGQPEKSLIGYYDLDLSETELKAQRVILDPDTEGFAYQKHPSIYPGTNLLFFHSAQELDGPKKLYVRQLGVNTKIYKMSDLLLNSVELKGVKHANSSTRPTGLYFVGRKKGDPKIEMQAHESSLEQPILLPMEVKDIYWISNEEVQKISRQVK